MQIVIEQRGFGLEIGGSCEGTGAVERDACLMSNSTQGVGHQPRGIGVVVHDEDPPPGRLAIGLSRRPCNGMRGVEDRLGSLMHADRILFLEDGRVVERGSHAELIALNGRYRALYDLQLRPEVA